VLRFSSILAEAPLQVYSSALVFAPETSVVRKTFMGQVPQAVQMLAGRDAEWDACRSVLEGHTDWVNAVAFSTDGQLLASASDDRTVRVWETATGGCRSVLEGHTDYVRALVFSADGQLLASASGDKTVRVWETATGGCRSVLKGHTADVNAVVFSADGQLLASASWDSTVRVWETATGGCRSVLKGHTGSVNAVVFSTDGQLLASASGDKTVRVWETATGGCRSVLKSRYPYTYHLTFSLDGRVLHTDKGDIPLPPDLYSTSSLKEEEQSSQLAVVQHWMLHSTQRLLWLPFEYRTYIAAVHKDVVCLGCSSGRVAILRLR
jgi:WD40 repeat protein